MLDTPDLPFDDLTFVTEGEAVYQVNDTVCVLKRGDAVYLPARASRKARNSGMECFAFTSSFPQARYCRCPANFILEWKVRSTLCSRNSAVRGFLIICMAVSNAKEYFSICFMSCFSRPEKNKIHISSK